MAVVRCQRARFSNPLLILCSWDSSFFLHYHLRGHSPLNAHALCAFHSSCSPIMDYCHLVEKQGWLPDGSFAISGSKVKYLSSGEKCIFFLSCIFWSSKITSIFLFHFTWGNVQVQLLNRWKSWLSIMITQE